MIYITPDYYDQFQCAAGNCPDTCCAGWQIGIDEESLEKYKNIQGEYLWKVMACVDWEHEVFRQDKAKRCAFLNADNLCELYQHEGEKSLCKTCRNYPRHIEEFEGTREIILSMSCPIAAQILMEREEPVFFREREDELEETEDFEEFDLFLCSILEDARKEMFAILQERGIPLRERALLVLAMAHDMQGRINRRDMFACQFVIEKYAGERAQKYIHAYAGNFDPAKETELAKTFFERLSELEVLREDWPQVLQQVREVLFSEKGAYQSVRCAFAEAHAGNTRIQIQSEQILVYFLSTYLLGAVYDGKVFAKVQMCVYCTWMIELLWMTRWQINGGAITEQEKTELFYRFCREIEHSDENLLYLDKMLEYKWLLKKIQK